MSEENGDYLESVRQLLKTSHIADLTLMFVEFEALDAHDSSAKINFVSHSLDNLGLLNHSKQVQKVQKSNEKSDVCRNEGNKLYAKSDYKAAVIKYNESLCFAESSKNLALAYANRSAACFELQMYSTCIQNINLAKSHEYPAEKMDKLDQRAEKCRQLIAEGAETDENMLKPISGDFLKLSYPPHPKLPYIANCLDVRCNEEFGRHVITKKKLVPGEVVCIESPFFKSFGRNRKYRLCINCMDENCLLSLMPCQLNASVMFCSQKCKDEAFDSYYKYKVDIIDELHAFHPYHSLVYQNAVESFFKSLRICGGSLVKLKEVFDESENNPEFTILDAGNPTDHIGTFKSILTLKSHENKLTPNVYFNLCTTIAVIADLFMKHTRLTEILKTQNDQDFFRSFLFKTTLINSINSFGLSVPVLSDGNDKQMPEGVFPFLSLLSHSCDPNAYQIVRNGEISIIVKKLIKSGEQLFISYCDTFANVDYESRRLKLKESVFFDCKCEACVKRYPLAAGLESKIEMSNVSSILQKWEIMEDSKKMTPVEFVETNDLKSLFTKISNFLIKHQHLHPSKELIGCQGFLENCTSILLMSKLEQLTARLKK